MSGLSLILHLIAAVCLLPAALAEYFRASPHEQASRYAFLVSITLAVAAPVLVSIDILREGWRTGFALNLWISVAATAIAFAVLAAFHRKARPLTMILMPYLFVLALLASIWAGSGQGVSPQATGKADSWFVVHIVLSVSAYAVTTLAAVASFAVMLQEQALKRRRPTRFTHRLPAAADGEAMARGLLIGSAILLGLGVVTGMATLMVEEGRLFVADHKTILSALSFAAILSLVLARRWFGLRGRKASHFVLSAYLLITLAYPGVKFVSDVLIG